MAPPTLAHSQTENRFSVTSAADMTIRKLPSELARHFPAQVSMTLVPFFTLTK
jgi:hypothetical protein